MKSIVIQFEDNEDTETLNNIDKYEDRLKYFMKK